MPEVEEVDQPAQSPSDQPQQYRPLPAWDEVADQFRTAYPHANQDQIRTHYNAVREENDWHMRLNDAQENMTSYWLRRSPFAWAPVIGYNARTARDLQEAERRMQAGTPQAGDPEFIATQTRLRAIDRDRQSTLGGQITEGVAGIPALIGESVAGGAAVRGLGAAVGIGGRAAAPAASVLSREGLAGLGRAAVGQAAMTPLMPSLYGQGAVERNLAAGRDANDWRGYPPSLIRGAMTNAVLGVIGPAARAVGGEGMRGVIGRTLAGAGVNVAGSQIDRVLASAISEALPENWRLESGYGAFGAAFRGDWGQVWQQVAVDGVIGAAFSTVHEAERLQEPRRGMAAAPGAAEPGPEPTPGGGPEPSAGPSGGPEPGPRPGAEPPPGGERAGPEPGWTPPPRGRGTRGRSARQVFSDAMDRIREAGLNTDAIGAEMRAELWNLQQAPTGGDTRPFADRLADVLDAFIESRLRGRQAGSQGPTRTPEEAQPQTAPEAPEQPSTPQGDSTAVQVPQSEPAGQPGGRLAAPPAPEQARPTVEPAAPPVAEPRQIGAKPSRPRTLREQFAQTDVLEGEVGGRRVEMRFDEGRNALQIDFDKPVGEPSGVSRTGLRPGTVELARALSDVVGKAKAEGLGVTFITEPGRAAHYTRGLERRGFHQVGEPEAIAGRSGVSRYTFQPGKPTPKQRIVAADPRTLQEALAAADLSPVQHQVLTGLANGLSLAEAGREAGLRTRQAAHYHAKQIAKAFGMEASVFKTLTADHAKALSESADLARQAGHQVGFTAEELRTNPDLQAALRRAKAPLTPDEKRQLAIAKLTDEYLKASEAAGGSLSAEAEAEFEQELSRLSETAKPRNRAAGAASVRAGAGQRVPAGAQGNPPAGEGNAPAGPARGAPGQVAAAGGSAAGGRVLAEARSLAPAEVDHAQATVRRRLAAAGVDPDTARSDSETFVQLAHEDAARQDAAEAAREIAGGGPGGAVARTGAGAEPGGTGEPGAGQGQRGGIVGAARAFLGEEAGTLDLEAFQRGVSATVDAIRRYSGQMFPTTTRLSRESGEAVSRMAVSRTYAAEAAGYFTDLILGDAAGKPEARQLAGAVLTERRLRYMRTQFARLAKVKSDAAFDARAAAHNATTPEQRLNAQRDARRFADEATEYLRLKNHVTTIIGKEGSPLRTLDDYQTALNSSFIDGVMRRWNNNFVPFMEETYRRAVGLDETDPVVSVTQIPGSPVSLKPVRGGDEIPASTVFTSSTGRLSNPRARKLRFSRQAEGDADAYDIDLGNMIDYRVQNSVPLAAQAEMYRVLQENGLLRWGHEGERLPFGERQGMELPNVKPPKGTQAAIAGQTSAFVHPDAAVEVRNALAVDAVEPWMKVMGGITAVPTLSALASLVEPIAHGTNLVLSLVNPRMMRNVFRAAYDYLRNDPEARRDLLELARIGAMKPRGPEGGTIVTVLNALGRSTIRRELPAGAERYDPTYWTGRMLRVCDRLIRLTARRAHAQMVKEGLQQPSETAERNLINQLTGQYERRAQNGIVRLLRNTGLQPFATAFATMTARAVRIAHTGGTGATPTSAAASARLRANVIMKLLACIAGAAALNFLRWGRVDGSDETPLFEIRVGTTNDGKTVSVPTPASLLLNRGWRASGASAVVQGVRRELPGETIRRNMIRDIWGTAEHQFMGPAPNFVHTALTGENALGRHVAERVQRGENPYPSNLAAAFGNLNPVYGAMWGFDQRHGDEPQWYERVARMLGPLGPRFREGAFRP